MFILRIFTLILSLALLGACVSTNKEPVSNDQSDTGPYSSKKLNPDGGYTFGKYKKNKSMGSGQLYKAKPSKSLEIPPDILATTNEAVLQNRQANKNDQIVLPNIIGAKIVKQEDKRWLEIDSDVEQAWKIMTEYWSLSNINLVEFNPNAGIMETDWIEEKIVANENDSAIKQVAKQLITSLTNKKAIMDKYRIRFERKSNNKTIMYVSHRSIKREGIYHAKKISEFAWVEAPDNQEKVDDFLQTIILIFDQSAMS